MRHILLKNKELGNAKYAKLISEVTNEVPRGWKLLGSGVSRRAYLGPDKVVYKVLIYKNDKETNKNEHEVAVALREHLSTKENNLIYIPETKLYDDVLAMEYIEKDKAWTSVTQEHRTQFYDIGLYDLHSGNAMLLKDGRLAVIDLGMSDKKKITQYRGR